MPHEVAFLHAILTNPDDDGPRLIYADWLEENGDPDRAEFIHLQIGMARAEAEDPRQEEWQRRENELLWDNHYGEWVKPLPHWARGRASFQRGFVTMVGGTAEEFLNDGVALRRAVPLEGLALSRAADPMARLVVSPLLSGLKELNLSSNELRPAEVLLLADCSRLSSLVNLRLSGNGFGPDGARLLAGSLHLSGLRELDLSSNAIGSAGVEALARSPHLKRLRNLNLSHNEIGDAGARALAAPGEILAGLTDLDLGNNDIGAVGCEALASCPHLTHLVVLRLINNRIRDAGLQALAASPHLARLRTLDLTGTTVGDPGLQALASSPHFAGLTRLELWMTKVREVGVQALAVSAHFPNLKAVSLPASPRITPDLRRAIAQRFGAGVL